MITKRHIKNTTRKAGLSIIEVGIGITIAALFASISYNQMLAQRPVMALTDVSWDLMSELRLARAAAIAENTRSVISYTRDGIMVETDSNRDAIITNDERRSRTFSNSDIMITRSQTDPVAFTGSGRFILNTTTPTLAAETLQLKHPDSPEQWTITIYANGQVKLDKTI